MNKTLTNWRNTSACKDPETEKETKTNPWMDLLDMLDEDTSENSSDENEDNETFANEPTPQEKLDALVGLKSLKEDLQRASILARFHKRRQDLQLEDKSQSRHHMLFLGNPGTGKTTVASIVGELFHEMGLLSDRHTVMTERSKLLGEYIGGTENRMQEVINEARGGVLFIDEAYTLFHGDEDKKDYGQCVLDSLLTVLAEPDPDMIVILAGYEKPMQEMLKSNPGLRDRFPLQFRFEDFSEDELVEVALRLAQKFHYEYSAAAEKQLRRIIHNTYVNRDAHFSNARWVHNFFEQGIEKCMAFRVMASDEPDKDKFMRIEEADLLEAERTYLKDNISYKITRPRIGFVA